MKGMKTTIRLALALVAVLAVLRIQEHVRLSRSERNIRIGARLSQAQLNFADELRISRNGTEFVFNRKDDTWKITAPVAANASSMAVMQFLDTIEKAKIIDFIPENEIATRELSDSDFGFSETSTSIRVSGVRPPLSFSVGYATPSKDGTFIKLGSSKGIVITDAAIAKLKEIPLEDFSDRRLCSANLRDVDIVVIESQNQVPLRLKRDRANGRWLIEQPDRSLADWKSMVKFFDAIGAARIESFYYGPVDENANTEEAPVLSIKLYPASSPFPATISVASRVPGTDDAFMASTDSGARAIVTGAVVRAMSITDNDIRDRKVFVSAPVLEVASLTIDGQDSRPISLKRDATDGWLLVSQTNSIPANPMVVSAMIGEMLGLEATGYVDAPGLREKDIALPRNVSTGPSISMATPTTTNKLECFFSESSPGITNALIVVDDADFAAVVPLSALANTLAAANGPEAIASRLVADINPLDMSLVAIVRKGLPAQILTQTEPGIWKFGSDTVDSPELKGEALSVLTNRLSHIEARAVASVFANADHPAPFTAEDTVLELTISFKEHTRSPVTLLLGGFTKDHRAVYCNIKGNDEVFEINDDFFHDFNRGFNATEVSDTDIPSKGAK